MSKLSWLFTIGNGIAGGVRILEAAFKADDDLFYVTVCRAEPHLNSSRFKFSAVIGVDRFGVEVVNDVDMDGKVLAATVRFPDGTGAAGQGSGRYVPSYRLVTVLVEQLKVGAVNFAGKGEGVQARLADPDRGKGNRARHVFRRRVRRNRGHGSDRSSRWHGRYLQPRSSCLSQCHFLQCEKCLPMGGPP